MQFLKTIIIMMFAMIISLYGNILVMTHGWGLQPKSWNWVILCALGFNLLVSVLLVIGKEK